jgi:hypothetical protein
VADDLRCSGNYADGSTFWIAGPGVRPIAMTPDRIAALEDAADALDYQHLMRAADCDTPREDDVNIPGGCLCKEHEDALRAMLAEARDEVHP